MSQGILSENLEIIANNITEYPAAIRVNQLPGHIADAVGSAALQEYANKYLTMFVIVGPSLHHNIKRFVAPQNVLIDVAEVSGAHVVQTQ